MIQLQLPDGAVIAIIEPGNIERLKQGKPMQVGNVLIAFTPDMEHLAELLGIKGLPDKGVRIECPVNLRPEQIDAALKACRDRAEVSR